MFHILPYPSICFLLSFSAYIARISVVVCCSVSLWIHQRRLSGYITVHIGQKKRHWLEWIGINILSGSLWLIDWLFALRQSFHWFHLNECVVKANNVPINTILLSLKCVMFECIKLEVHTIAVGLLHILLFESSMIRFTIAMPSMRTSLYIYCAPNDSNKKPVH